MNSGSGAEAEAKWVAVALLLRVWGNGGELSAVPLSSHPERFQDLREVYLFGAEAAPGEAVPYEVESVWQHGPRLIFKFRGVDSIGDAERLRGAEVRVRFEDRAPLPPDEYYHSDLLGCEVVDRPTGEKLGTVLGWQDYGGTGLLEVGRPGQEEPLLVPFARSICVEIDVKGRRIAVELPEGLRE